MQRHTQQQLASSEMVSPDCLPKHTLSKSPEYQGGVGGGEGHPYVLSSSPAPQGVLIADVAYSRL